MSISSSIITGAVSSAQRNIAEIGQNLDVSPTTAAVSAVGTVVIGAGAYYIQQHWPQWSQTLASVFQRGEDARESSVTRAILPRSLQPQGVRSQGGRDPFLNRPHLNPDNFTTDADLVDFNAPSSPLQAEREEDRRGHGHLNRPHLNPDNFDADPDLVDFNAPLSSPFRQHTRYQSDPPINYGDILGTLDYGSDSDGDGSNSIGSNNDNGDADNSILPPSITSESSPNTLSSNSDNSPVRSDADLSSSVVGDPPVGASAASASRSSANNIPPHDEDPNILRYHRWRSGNGDSSAYNPIGDASVASRSSANITDSGNAEAIPIRIKSGGRFVASIQRFLGRQNC